MKSSTIMILFYACLFCIATATASQARDVTLQWDPSTDTAVTGYKVHYNADSAATPFSGTGSLQGASPIDVKNLTGLTVTGLDPNRAYYFAATTYNASGTESSYSNIVTVSEAAPPTVSITSPAANATISGTISVAASAADNVGVTKVEFYRDGILLATDTSTPYVYPLNTALLAPGIYTLMARAYDAAGNAGQSGSVSVTVVNDTIVPTVSLTAPANNATVSGITTVTASAGDNVGVNNVEFYRDGVLLYATNVAPFSYSWNTTTVANGSYTLTAKAYDNSGNVGQSAGVTATVNNTITAPAGSVTAVFGNTAGADYPNTIEDTYLNIDTSINVTSTILSTYTWPAGKPANAILMKWNLSGLPADAQIQSATLGLYMTGSGGDVLYEMPVSGIINKVPIIAKSNGNTYDGTNAWTPSSLPYAGIPLAQSDIATATDAPLVDKTIGYKNWNVTSLVKDWVVTPGNNKGLLVNSSSKASADSNRVFASSEAVDATQRPKLIITYIVASDVVAPTVAITAPGSSATVSGTVSVSATASDNVKVTRVEFYVNGVLSSTVVTAPYGYSWVTTTVANGLYSITAKAYDAAGNIGYSSSITVAVNNPVADTTAPTVSISAPFNNSTVSGTIPVAAAATDNVAVSKVEFYVNGVLQTTDTVPPYSFNWNSTSALNGSNNLIARAYDAAGNTGTSSTVLVTVSNTSTTYSIWSPASVPSVVDSGPDSAVELGVKFRSDVKGYITGIRFYKAATNTGTHIANLWSATGKRLATATFVNETSSGWQQVNFTTPVAVSANTVYVASYHTNVGHYSDNQNYFATAGVDNGPLHALANGVSGANGVYAYGTASAFPKQGYLSTNYWVDIVFKP